MCCTSPRCPSRRALWFAPNSTCTDRPVSGRSLEVVMESKRLNAEHALAFIFAGKAVVTLRSAKTGTRYTYKVSKAEEREGQAGIAPAAPRYFVSLLTG